LCKIAEKRAFFAISAAAAEEKEEKKSSLSLCFFGESGKIETNSR